MMNRNKIFLDMDDVLLDTANYFYKWHKAESPYLTSTNLGKRDNGEMIGLNWQKAWNELPFEFWSSIPKAPFADNLISVCEDSVGEENVFILTSAISNTDCYAGKSAWINKYLPKYKSKLFIGQKKHIVVDEYSLLIDDYEKHEKNFSAFNKANNFLLFPAYGNRLFSERCRIDVIFKLDNKSMSTVLFIDMYGKIIRKKIDLINENYKKEITKLELYRSINDKPTCSHEI